MKSSEALPVPPVVQLCRLPMLLMTIGVMLLTYCVWPSAVDAGSARDRSSERGKTVQKKTVFKKAQKKVIKKSDPRKVSKAASLHKSRAKQKARLRERGKKGVQQARKSVQAKAFYCINAANNEILMARNADKQLPVASLTKLVTALVVLDHAPFTRELTVPDHIGKVPKSVVGLKPGDRLSFSELLHGLLIGSGNDCAETLACAFPGGKSAFVKAMNRKARSLGTHRTVFYTPSGLDRRVVVEQDGKKTVKVDSNASTAREISVIARAAFSHPTIRKICQKKSYVLRSENTNRVYVVRNTNKLLRDNLPLIGGKTGYTSRAGHCLASEFATRKAIFVIVVLGSPDHFRDTRLVYHKALKEVAKGATAQAPLFKRVAYQAD